MLKEISADMSALQTRVNIKHIAGLLFFILTCFSAFAQKTMSTKTATEREAPSTHKVMLIPFEPRLYMSEIDMQVARETKLSSKEIRHLFRDGLNEQLQKNLKVNKYSVVDLMEDTAKYKKDIEGIYQYLSYSYMKVPDQNNYKAPVADKKEKKIDKGQLNVETNSEIRFMNAKVTNAKLVPLLYGKYKTDIFIFINQLDIKASGSPDPSTMMNESPLRKITVHYTVYTYDAKEINSGIAETEFDPALNNPKKIIDKHFSKVASVIVARVTRALVPGKK
jgi:hypothetical protein